MERELQQLLIIVAVVAFSLLDLLLRWAKRKMGGQGPQGPLPEADDDGAFESAEVNVPWPLPDAPPARPPEPTRAPEPRRPAAARPVLAPARSVEPPRASTPSRPAAGIGRRRVARFTERDARQAIVYAAVFGPPRGLDGDR